MERRSVSGFAGKENVMLNSLNNVGDDIYRSWSDDQRRQEIGNLVQGLKQGLPIQIVCEVAASIAGGREEAKLHFAALLTQKERKSLVKNQSQPDTELRTLLKACLL